MRALRAIDPSAAVAPQHIEAALAARFEIVQKWPRGGTLLAPIFGSGCLDPAMADSPEGLALLAAMFEAEQDLVQAVKTEPGRMLPFADADFDSVAGTSVFTHMNERNQFFYLDELQRVTSAGAKLFLTVSGARVLERAETEPNIAKMLAMPEGGLVTARAAFDAGPGFCFLLQHGHLNSREYEGKSKCLRQSALMRMIKVPMAFIGFRCGGFHPTA
jgi:hypothetical protein